jgi:hypothetical protein
MKPSARWRKTVSAVCVSIAGLVVLGPLCGCLMGGYSSGGGFFIWPGSIVVTLLMVLFIFLRRGR